MIRTLTDGRANGEPMSCVEVEMTERFERLARLTRRLFDVPIVAIDLDSGEPELDNSGMPDDATPSLHHWLRRHADPVYVEDALVVPSLAPVLGVAGLAGLRSFAGHPLHQADGRRCGSLLVASIAARSFDSSERELLNDLARSVELQIQATGLATIDELTGLSNRRGFHRHGGSLFQLCKRHHHPMMLLYFDLDGFKGINDRYGHTEGDNALVAFAHLLTRSFRTSDLICRMGGDEFVVLAPRAEPMSVELMLERTRASAAELHRQGGTRECLSFSAGSVAFDVTTHPDLQSLLREGDQAMYQSKRSVHASHRPRPPIKAPHEQAWPLGTAPAAGEA